MKTFAFVGKWELKRSDKDLGFAVFSCDEATGALQGIKDALPDIVVGSTCLDRERGILYVAHEYDALPGISGGGCGAVAAVSLNPETGDMTELNRMPSYGVKCSCCAFDLERKYLLVTNLAMTGRIPVTKIVKDPLGTYQVTHAYDDATTVLFRLNSDGSIGEAIDVYLHTGRGAHESQTNPHAHSVVMSPDGKQFFVCDKGTDSVSVFEIDRKTERLKLCGEYSAVPGSAPRYSVFHPTRPFWFANHELMPVVSSWYIGGEGCIVPVNTASVAEKGQASSILLSANGRFLYNIVRVVNAAAVFSVDEETGVIERIQYMNIPVPEGLHPMQGVRGAALSPDGRFLYITVMAAGQVVAMPIGEDGKLTGGSTVVAKDLYNPANITFFQAQV